MDKKAGEGGGYINMDAGGTPQQLLKGFSPLLALTEVLGLVLVILVAVWCGEKGFAWRSNPDLEFNWHPLLMVIGLIFLNGNAILTFRILRNNRKVLLKYIHGGIQVLTLPLIVIGLVAVFDSHNLKTPVPTPNLYSLHSWIGLGTVILFFSQYLVGLTAFLFPGLSAEYRSIILPYHVFNGVAIFALSIAASLIGLNEKAFFVLPNTYGQLPGEAVLINMIGVVMVVFGLLVGLLVTKAEYKRTPLPEDGSPLLAASSRQ
ncbi:Cytochrome b561 [Frankliniella fusca]|uniref:Cytochrome b561 n=1 Tax=Frankliniella fusca TaxID=407009 RepID=A0AAE1HRX4_9NEOP|nr:Cytochrome b561 [Frankliniella fusca]